MKKEDTETRSEEIYGNSTYESGLEDSNVYEVLSQEDVVLSAAAILDMSETEYKLGAEILCRNDTSFKILYTLFTLLLAYTKTGFTYVVEEDYVDRVYRDSYYFYYSGKNFSYCRYCKRILLFAQLYENPIFDLDSEELSGHYVGNLVIRPIKNKIGRSYLNPRFFLNQHTCYLRLTKYNVTAFGKRLYVNAFPYSIQDGETTTCAEITILNLLDYYSKTYAEYHYLLPSEIHKISLSTGFQRSLPSHGLQYETITKIFCETGFWPRLYNSQKMKSEKMRRMLYYYVESGIPLSLGIDVGAESNHSVVVIGHGKTNQDTEYMKSNLHSAYNSKDRKTVWLFDTADSVESFCIMDDNDVPYSMRKCYVKNEEGNIGQENVKVNAKAGALMLDDTEILQMMVPLYKKMYLEAGDAGDIFKTILASSDLGICTADCWSKEMEAIGTKENPIVVRIFMASARGFSKKRRTIF